MIKISFFTHLTDEEQKTLNFLKHRFGMNFGDEISMKYYKTIKELAKFALWENALTDQVSKGELSNE